MDAGHFILFLIIIIILIMYSRAIAKSASATTTSVAKSHTSATVISATCQLIIRSERGDDPVQLNLNHMSELEVADCLFGVIGKNIVEMYQVQDGTWFLVWLKDNGHTGTYSPPREIPELPDIMALNKTLEHGPWWDPQTRRILCSLSDARFVGVVNGVTVDPGLAQTSLWREAFDTQADILNAHAQVVEEREKSTTDEKTGLPNAGVFFYEFRRVLVEIQRSLSRAESGTTSVQIVDGFLLIAVLDLNHLKAANFALGRPGGDQVIMHMVNELRKLIRKNDVLSRWAGDELAYLGRFKSAEEAKLKLQELTLGVSKESFRVENAEGRLITWRASVATGGVIIPANLALSIEMAADLKASLRKFPGLRRMAETDPEIVRFMIAYYLLADDASYKAKEKRGDTYNVKYRGDFVAVNPFEQPS